jgi:cytochrome c biogenesis protein CcdA
VTDVGYLAAFLGGVLALISPCSALLLPSFFAYAFTSGRRLLANTAVFYLGLAATLVPLGAGSSAVTGLINGHRETVILVAGWVIIALGVAQVLGGGFALRPVMNAQQRFLRRGGWIAVFGLGATYGLAGFCSGPILGAVLTIAAVGGQAVRGAALLAVYALGMAAPLFVLAALWQRFDLGRRQWIRGRAFRLGPLQLHTTTTVSGLLFIVIGALFVIFNGTATLSLFGLAPSPQTQLAVQGAVRHATSGVSDLLLLSVVAVVILVIGGIKLRSTTRRSDKATATATARTDESDSE